MERENRWAWVWPGIAVVAVVVAFATLSIRSIQDQSITTEKPHSLELVHSMRLALLAAAESQSCAIISEDSESIDKYLAQANHSVQNFSQALAELEKPEALAIDSALLSRTKEHFERFVQVQSQIKTMLEKSTNRRAYELATGSYLSRVEEVDVALSKLLEAVESEQDNGPYKFAKAAWAIRLSILRIQTLLIPHISEPTDEVMRRLEARMNVEETSIESNMAVLQQTPVQKAEVVAIGSLLAQLTQQRTQILELSRENSNIRSEALAMTQRRDALLACDATLVELEKFIRSQRATSMLPGGR